MRFSRDEGKETRWGQRQRGLKLSHDELAKAIWLHTWLASPSAPSARPSPPVVPRTKHTASSMVASAVPPGGRQQDKAVEPPMRRPRLRRPGPARRHWGPAASFL